MEEKATFHVIKVLLYRSIRQILIIDTNFCACFSNNPSFGKGEIKKRKIGGVGEDEDGKSSLWNLSGTDAGIR